MSLGTKSPSLPPPPPPIAVERQVDTDVQKNRQDQRKRAIQAFGFPSTNRTGAGGLGDDAPVRQKSLLGS